MTKTFPFLQEDEEYYFDSTAVQRVIDFIERFCRLADPMGEPFILLPWQRQIVTDVFGWKRRDNDERRFNWAYIEVPRKNGKTYFVAALLIYLLMADGVAGAEVYASACTREQSSILFKSVLRMVNQSQFLSERLTATLHKSLITYKPKGSHIDSTLKALSGESKGSHGKYPSAVVADELHEWTDPKSDSLFEALTSGFGNRKSPLVIMITTAGFGSQPTLAKRMHEKAERFKGGELTDPTFYGVIYGATADDDWTKEKTWKKANPSWELAVKNLKREYPKAKLEPSEENKFKRLYLNIWTQQQTRWLNLEKYDAVVEPLRYDDYKGQTLYLGLDLSQIYDLTAISLIYPKSDGKWSMFVRCYMPLKQIERRSKEDAIPYDQWADKGHLIPTTGVSNGQTIDYETVIRDIAQLSEENELRVVGYDPANAISVIPQLESLGINCLPIYQSYKEMSPASKEFERRLTSGEIVIAENPCLRWQIGNVEIASDPLGNIRPVKPNTKGSYGGTSKYKVDGVVASIIAVQATLLIQSRNETADEDVKPAVYFV